MKRHSELFAQLDAAIARWDEASRVEVRATSGQLHRAAGTLRRYVDGAISEADVAVDTAEAARRRVLERVRAGTLSNKHVRVLARLVSTQLDEVKLAVADATAARDADAREVIAWTERTDTAARHGREDLAAQARARTAEWRSRVEAHDVALRDYVELEARLRELGGALLATTGS